MKKLDMIDKRIEKTTEYKKIHEEVGKSTYIRYKKLLNRDTNMLEKIESERVDLEVINAMNTKISSFYPESSCPYGGKKCALSLYSNEFTLFRKKLFVMRIRWVADYVRIQIKRFFGKLFK